MNTRFVVVDRGPDTGVNYRAAPVLIRDHAALTVTPPSGLRVGERPLSVETCSSGRKEASTPEAAGEGGR